MEKHLKQVIRELEENKELDSGDSYSTDTIDEYNGKEIAIIARTMLAKISTLREQFGIEPNKELPSKKRKIYGKVIEVAAILDDLRPVAMKSYGSLSSEDEKILGGIHRRSKE